MSNKTWKEVVLSSPGPTEKRDYFLLFIKGFMMGIADLIPGVSGGTIAFITGIYENLLEAVSSVKKDTFVKICQFKFKEALSQIHLRFLITLFTGLLLAIFSLARVMHYLINEQAILTWSAFFGLIAASIILIWNELDKKFSGTSLAFIVIGAVVAWITVSLIPVTTPFDSWFIFLCGLIGITAMILPGLSGSFLLLILGKYEYITGAIKNPFIPQNFQTLVFFTLGTASGLLCFTKVLNYLLKQYRNQTMAFLTGILIGSMRKVWPWKEVLETKIVRGKVRILREANILPSQFDSEVIFAILLMCVGFLIVFGLDRFSKDKK